MPIGSCGSAGAGQIQPGTRHPHTPRKLTVFIDITNKCNLRCIMCHFAYPHLAVQTTRHMEPLLFEKIASQLAPFTQRLVLSAATEPTASPFFPEILRIAERVGIDDIGFLTNGNTLSDELEEAISKAPVAEIAVSLHGARPETYASIHRGGKLSRVLRNIGRLVAIREKNRRKIPRVGLHCTLMRRNIAELPEIVRVAAEAGLDFISMRHLILFEGLGLSGETLSHDRLVANQKIQQALELASALRLPVRACPDYYRVPGYNERSQMVQWNSPADSESSTSACRTLRRFLTGFAARRLLNFCLAEPRTAVWCGLRLIGRKPLGAITQRKVSRDGMLLGIEGWALAPAGIRSVVIKVKAASGGATSHSSYPAPVVLGTARFHNAGRSGVVFFLSDYLFSYRTAWSFDFEGGLRPDNGLSQLSVEATDGAGQVCEIGRIKLNREGRGVAIDASPLCPKPFNSLYIDHLGQAFPYPDCRMAEGVGWFEKQSFEEIWWGDKMEQLRMNLLAGKPPEMCRHCALWANARVDDDSYHEPLAHLDRSPPAGFPETAADRPRAPTQQKAPGLL